ncbi:MAG: SRPBCC family protein [Actinomycetota bacterium]|nr:SRPBCC family protein [Actinomycetota bacterium]
MDRVTVSVAIARPREQVFEYLADLANHAEFTDHYLLDWHLTRENSYGLGAGARFRLKAPGNRFGWGDVTVVEFERPARIAEKGRGGKYNRITSRGEYRLTPRDDDGTDVEFSLETEPGNLSDRIMESLGARRFVKRQNAKALRRLRTILEKDEGRGRRATVAGR